MFISKDHPDIVLDSTSTFIQKNVPKQLPPGVDEEALRLEAERARDLMNTLFYV